VDFFTALQSFSNFFVGLFQKTLPPVAVPVLYTSTSTSIGAVSLLITRILLSHDRVLELYPSTAKRKEEGESLLLATGRYSPVSNKTLSTSFK